MLKIAKTGANFTHQFLRLGRAFRTWVKSKASVNICDVDSILFKNFETLSLIHVVTEKFGQNELLKSHKRAITLDRKWRFARKLTYNVLAPGNICPGNFMKIG